MEAVNEIVVTTDAGATLTSAELLAGVTDRLVASVNEKNNSTAGYTVTLVSANTGGTQARLLGGDPTNSIDYSIIYNGAPIALTEGSAVVTTDGTNTDAAGVDKNLAVTTTAGWHNADTYSDTLTLTIASK